MAAVTIHHTTVGPARTVHSPRWPAPDDRWRSGGRRVMGGTDGSVPGDGTRDGASDEDEGPRLLDPAAGDVRAQPGYAEGLWSVQDPSAIAATASRLGRALIGSSTSGARVPS